MIWLLKNRLTQRSGEKMPQVVVAALRGERKKCYWGVKKTTKASLDIKDVDTWSITLRSKIFDKSLIEPIS